MLLLFGGIMVNGYASTITWMVNGSVYTTTTSTTGKVGALPKTDPTSFNANYPYFEGWFATPAAMDGAPDEAAPATQVTTTTAITGDVTFYAVFTNAIDGVALKKATSISNGDVVYLASSDNAAGLGVIGAGLYVSTYQAYYKDRPHTDWIPFVVDGSADNFVLKNRDKGGITITNASFTLGKEPYSQLRFHKDGYFISKDDLVLMYRTKAVGYPSSYVGSSDYTLFYMYKRITPGYVSTTCSDGVTVALTPAEETINLGANGTATTIIACTKTGGNGGGSWSYEVSPATGNYDGTTFTATAAGTYTVYATYTETCNSVGKTTVVVTAIPTVAFTTTPADPVVFPTVECGETTALSDKKAVAILGYNLSDVIIASVSSSYKIALSADAALSDYAQSVTIPANSTGKIDAANTTIYIIACPPQNSTAPTTGTLTITATGGNTITANLSTPDITCSGYTLSLNNNGTVTTAGVYCAGAYITKPADATISADCPYTFDGWSETPVENGSSTYTKIDFGTYTMPKGNTTLYAVYSQTEGSKIYGTETIVAATGWTSVSGFKATNEQTATNWTWNRTKAKGLNYIYIGETYKFMLLHELHSLTVNIKDNYEVSSIYVAMNAAYNSYGKNFGDAGIVGADKVSDGDNYILTPSANTITISQTNYCYVDSFVVSYSTGEMTTTYYSDLACGYTTKEVTTDETIADVVNQNMDVIVKNGATLTVAGTSQLHNLTIEGGATVVLPNNAALTVAGMYLAGGWVTINGAETYDMPRLYIEDSSTLATDNDSIFLDLTIDKSNYYPFAVPFDAKVSDIRYADAELAKAATYGTHYVVKTYDGALRATGTSADNWVALATGETLTAGTGYIITAVPRSGDTRTVIRVPMAYTNGSTPRNTVAVTAYNNNGAAKENNIGWNFIANPYMASFHAAQLTGIDNLLYAQVPEYDFSDYKAVLLSETTLRPEWGFFVQVPESGTLNFATEGQQRRAIYAADEKNITNFVNIYLTNATLTAGDRLGLVINDRYTADYEIGADLERMFGEAYTLATYSVMNSVRLAFNALPSSEAEKTVAVGFRAPETGEYTFAIDPDQDTVGIQRIELYDKETDLTTNLLLADYTFTVAEPTQSDTRFTLRVILHRNIPSMVEDVFGNSQSTHKIINNGHLYIKYNGKTYDATGKVIKR